MRRSRLAAFAALATFAILVSRFFPAPPVVDAAAGGAFPARLEFPLSHLLLTPFASAADVITCESARQDIAFGVVVLLGFGLFRFFLLGQPLKGWFHAHDVFVAAALYVPLTAACLAWAILWPHAPPRLVPDDPDEMPVDFHSHSSLSWDGRRTFTPARNAAWHEAAGFGLSFLTDHNVFDAARSSGEEVSLHDAHVVLIGAKRFADREDYADTLQGVEDFLHGVKKSGGGFTILSLPEYREHYWGAPVEELAGLASGIELWTSSPKAMEISDSDRAAVVDLARRKGLFLAGATDNHGYGSCACVWSLVRVPGWRSMSAREREAAVFSALKTGFSAVQVAARPRVAPSAGDAVFLDGFRGLWLMVRSWTALQCWIALIWAWGFALAAPASRRGRK